MANSNKRDSNDKLSNIGKMREIVRNTEKNLMEAEFSKEFADPEQRVMIRNQNARRKHSMEELKQEIKEELGKGKES